MEFPLSAGGKQVLAMGLWVNIEHNLAASRELLTAAAQARGESFDPTAVEILAEYAVQAYFG